MRGTLDRGKKEIVRKGGRGFKLGIMGVLRGLRKRSV